MSYNQSTSGPLLNVNQAAERLGLSVSYLNKKRLTGDGPAYIKLGASVKYDPADIAAWLSDKKCRSTSETTVKSNGGA